jgi:hypothetical protein
VVAPIVGENLMPFAQLQCSRKSPRLHQLNLMKNQLPTASFRLRAYNKMGNGRAVFWRAAGKARRRSIAKGLCD